MCICRSGTLHTYSFVTDSFSMACAGFWHVEHTHYSNTINIDDKSINTCEKLFH